MASSEEKQGFSLRLADALRRAGLHEAGPSRIAREFNLRYHGDPVTTQAVRKWLGGLAVPSQDKMRVLAEWLDVPPQWLRFGEGSPEERNLTRQGQDGRVLTRQEAAAYRADYTALARKFELLSDPHRKIVFEIVLALLRLEGKQ